MNIDVNEIDLSIGPKKPSSSVLPVIRWKSTGVSEEQVASSIRVDYKPIMKPVPSSADFLFGVFFDPDDGGHTFLRNVG
jgi:hypothetical protein